MRQLIFVVSRIMKFTCSRCKSEHNIDDISFGINYPMQWMMLNEQEKSLSDLGEEQCIIQSSDGPSYYIRACLEIPVHGNRKPFTWGVWCSLSENSMRDVVQYWDDPIRVHRGPYFGWLCTIIPGYPDTAYLKTNVHQREVGIRPSVVLEPTNHQLAVDQRNGIDCDRLAAIIEVGLHGNG